MSKKFSSYHTMSPDEMKRVAEIFGKSNKTQSNLLAGELVSRIDEAVNHPEKCKEHKLTHCHMCWS